MTVAMGVLVDQVGRLRRIAAAMGEQKVRLAHAEGRLIMAVIDAYLEAIGLSSTPATRRVLSHLLEQAGRGEPPTPPAAEDAKADIRRQVGSELGGGPRLLPPGDDGGPRALPPPRERHETSERRPKWI